MKYASLMYLLHIAAVICYYNYPVSFTVLVVVVVVFFFVGYSRSNGGEF